MMQIQNILLVCIRNICRNFTAEYFFKHDHVGLNTESEGLSTMINYPADDKPIAFMNQFSIAMRPFIKKQVQAEYLKNTNLVLKKIFRFLPIKLIQIFLNRLATISKLIFQISNPLFKFI